LLPVIAIGIPVFTGFPASAQEAGDAIGEPLMLRGTTGSGEQETAFSLNEEITTTVPSRVAEVPLNRDTADPVEQLQGRARPAQPEPVILDPLATGTPTARANVATSKEQDGTGQISETDPFAATGLRMGSWQAFSSVTQTAGYSTNIDSVAGGKSGAFSRTDVDLSLRSDWSRHSARIDASGSFQRPFGSDQEAVPTGTLSGNLNLDLLDGIAVDLGTSYQYTTEAPTSTTLPAAAVNRPGVHATSGSAALIRSDRKLFYSLRGSVGRTDYEAVDLANGQTQSQGDRNNTLYSLIGRVGYEASAALSPYVELESGIRQYDLERDRNGDQRDSTIWAARTGVEIDLGEKLRGDVAMGYRTEQFDQGGLEDLSTLTLDGSLVWSPVRETNVTLSTSTDFSGATTAGDNGTIVNTFGLAIDRQITDRLSLNANAELTLSRDDDGNSTRNEWSVGSGFNYWINRFMALTGTVEHTNVTSETASASYDDTTFRAGLRFQR
jgi:hypothetical protein